MVTSLQASRVITGTPEDVDDDEAAAPRWVTLDDGHISAVGTRPHPHAPQVDLRPLQLWPAFTDLHADSLPRFESPRAGTAIPLEAALEDFATDAVAHGVVRPYLCISVGEGPDTADGYRRAHAVLQTLDRVAGELAVPVPVHLRVDVSDPESVDGTAELLRGHGRRIGLLSVMDHTPGQGQYQTERAWRPAMGTRLRLDDDELNRWLATLHRHATGTPLRRRQIARFAAAHNTVFATHDPDSEGAVTEAAAMHASICEFPLTLDAAAAARDNGLAVVMGAPNAWRGSSHLSNLSARDAIEAGVVDVLTSDYHSGALARAAVAISEAGAAPIDCAVAMLSTRPRRVISSSTCDTGALTPGQPADLVAVRTEPMAAVMATWSSGRQVSGPALW
jgi:alpha-D-ribose 1-methylphosphonate 5-triphosphate diphosphatase